MNPHNSPNTRLSAAADEFGSGGSSTESSGTLAEAKEKVGQATSKVKGAASNTAARAKDEAVRYAAEKKEATASRIGSYSSAMHDTAQSFEDKDPNIAWFAHRAADKLQSVAEYMRNRDFSALRLDAEDLARRHPGAFFGSMFLVGLVAGNMVKASRHNVDEDSSDYSGTDYASNYGSAWSGAEQGSDITQPELSESERSAAGI